MEQFRTSLLLLLYIIFKNKFEKRSLAADLKTNLYNNFISMMLMIMRWWWWWWWWW